MVLGMKVSSIKVTSEDFNDETTTSPAGFTKS